MRPPILNPRLKSLARANTVVWGSVIAALFMSGYPRVHADSWIAIPALMVLAGTADTLRNIRRQWSFYHAGVVLCLYMDLMAIFLVLFLLLGPYMDIGVRHI